MNDDNIVIDERESFFDDDDPINLFAAPDSADPNYDSDENTNMNTDVNDSWILLWIFKYQERFRLPDVAINSLIGFFSLVLKMSI